MIHEAYTEYLRFLQTENDKQHATKRSKFTKGSLWPSDVAKCHRAAILRVTGIPGRSLFSTQSLNYMNSGVIQEAETGNALRHVYNNRLTEQLELRYQMWSGKVDFAIDVDKAKPILIEHKMTSEKHWDNDAKTELPKREHVGQVMTYYWLYKNIYGVEPQVILYYYAWGNYAEFILSPFKNKIKVEANVNGVIDITTLDYDVVAEIEALMKAYDNPTNLPPKLDKQYKGCTFNGKPSCQFYHECWE